MSDSHLCRPGGRYGAFRRFNNTSNSFEYKLVRFHCGKKHCPICTERRRRKLILRLKRARWPETVQMWKITTDPKILDPETALRTLNRRWKRVHRNLSRLYPDFKYFRVIEFTESGLPHMHLLTSCYIDWEIFQQYLVSEDFGKVLHFTKKSLHTSLNYVCKYVAKGVYGIYLPFDFNGRMWAVSQGFLPQLTYGDGHGEWQLFWIDRQEDKCRDILHALELHDRDSLSPP